jgi:hypothetical protein
MYSIGIIQNSNLFLDSLPSDYFPSRASNLGLLTAWFDCHDLGGEGCKRFLVNLSENILLVEVFL